MKNRLSPVRLSYKKGSIEYWEYLCECGKTTVANKYHVKYGQTMSCGCLRIERIKKSNTVHGHSRLKNISTTYNSWRSIIERCLNKTSKDYPRYGGRGIVVCKKWQKFSGFYKDMGDRPNGKSIERMNNDLGYFKKNCRWATSAQQALNRRSSKILDIDGIRKTLMEWSRISGVHRATISSRIKSGHVIKDAVFKKPKN